MLIQFINSSILILIATSLLFAIYRMWELNWPDEYFKVEDKESIFISQTFLRYATFRILPLVIMILTSIGIVLKSNIPVFSPQILGLFLGLGTAIINDGRAIYHLLIKSPEIKIYRNYAKQILIHLVAIVILTSLGYLSGYIAQYNVYYSLLPNIIDVVNNFWTSLFTVLAIFIYRKMDRRLNIEIKIDNVIKNSDLGLSHELLQLIEEKSKDQNANEILVKAICIAENIERPAWFRKFEYFSSLIAKHGSYGIMQTQTDKPIDDKASINIAIEKYFKNTKYASKEEIEIAIRKYNNSDHYFRFIQEIITFILPQELHGYNYLRES